MSKLVDRFIKVSKLSEKDLNNSDQLSLRNLEDLEKVTGVKLTNKMKDFIISLSKIDPYAILNSDHYMVCKATTPGSYKPFGLSKRTEAVIGVPISYLNDLKSYHDVMSQLDVEMSLFGVKGRLSDLYKCFLFDSYDDGHYMIGIDYLGRVVEYIYEGDEEDCSILASNQDEFINKITIR